MHFFAVATAAASLFSVVYAQNQTVVVGANGTTTYSPSNITANVGDVITFQFVAGNHTVTQSTFASPCAQMLTPTTGITSGFQPVTSGAAQVPSFSFTVNNATTPLWFFCEHVGHCAKGMVFSVNAPATGKTFAAFQAAAIATGADASASASGASSAPSSSSSTTPSSALISRSSSVGLLAVAAGLVAGLLL
ncbi:Cupredoxin [Mycena maculata]|uniref:Cupredoxin n=1 Tax=Mycena maculata TaxID=230809 RepID=A0AAD7J941_9AGAR|nr:Cupredoxin [Mycena maculata]